MGILIHLIIQKVNTMINKKPEIPLKSFKRIQKVEKIHVVHMVSVLGEGRGQEGADRYAIDVFLFFVFSS